MKQKLLFLFVIIVGVVACSDEEVVDGWKPVQTGDEISFGAKQGYLEYNMDGGVQTRTHYGEKVTIEGKEYFPINWDNNDEIGIYCPQASAPLPFKEVDYKVIIDENSETNEGILAKVKIGESGLQWGDADMHHFYAMYPASATKGGISATEMLANIPMLQTPVKVDYSPEFGLYMLNPNMDYAFMYAHQDISKAEQGNTPITLDFKPLITTIRITVNGPKSGEPLQVSQVEIRSSEGICGDFLLTISEDKEKDGMCTPYPQGVQNNLITIPTYYEGRPITLKPGEKLIVKAFLLPYADPKAAQTAVTVRMVGKGSRTKILDKADIESKKINLTSLPALEGTDLSFWMTSLDLNTYISQLSIPGTHNSYANPNYLSNWEDQYGLVQRYQNKSIKEQFEAGARAFAFMADASMNVYTSNTSIDPLTTVLDTYYGMLTEKIAEYDTKYEGNKGNCRESIILYIDYKQQNGGNATSDEQKKERLQWLINLDRELNKWEHKDILVSNLTASTTVNDLKQKIVVLARYQGSVYEHTYVVEEAQWPWQEDKTETISYDPAQMELFTILRQPYTQTTDWANSKFSINNDRDIIGNYVIPGEGKTVGSVSEDGNTVNSNLYYWHQSLQRLQNPDENIWPKKFISGYEGNQTTDQTDRIDRKISDVKNLFERAMENNDPTNDSDAGLKNWYINNLGAFCVLDHDRSVNANLGDAGNSLLGAEEINVPIYDYLRGRDINAPIGVVLMNFLGEDKVSYDGKEYQTYGISLPQMIVDNNFKYQLKVKPSESANTKSATKTSYVLGGELW